MAKAQLTFEQQGALGSHGGWTGADGQKNWTPPGTIEDLMDVVNARNEAVEKAYGHLRSIVADPEMGTGGQQQRFIQKCNAAQEELLRLKEGTKGGGKKRSKKQRRKKSKRRKKTKRRRKSKRR